ncbi:MAG: hypothetical protein HC871_05850 [Rhizobiales bacterium]|nr:hypothetical protein [Hyphomicrobiales bacterium]
MAGRLFLITMCAPPSPIDVAEGEPSDAASKLGELVRANAALRRSVEESAKVAEELLAVRSELERSNGELQSFAHRVAHDVKVPLRSISRNAQFVIEDDGERISDESKRLLTKMVQAVQRLHALLDSLLAFAKVGAQQGTLPRSI